MNADDLDPEGGRVRVKAETSEARRRRFVDLPLTISEGKEVVKPEVAELMASWLRLRSRACPHLGEGDALFVTLGPNQFALGNNGTAPDSRAPGERLTTDAMRTILKRVAVEAGVDPHLVTPHRLRGDALREARTDELKALRDENARLKWLGLEAAIPVCRC